MQRRGILLALAAAALFGASTPAAKVLLGSADPWLLAGLLYLGSGIGLAFLAAIRRAASAAPTEARISISDMPWLAGAILTGGVAGPLLLMVGLQQTPASTSALLLNLEGLATMAIAWVVFRENVDRRLLIGAAAILAGAIVLSWQGGPQGYGFGALMIAGACIAWGIDNNLTRKISGADPVSLAMIKGLVAGALNLALAVIQGSQLPEVGTVLAAGIVGLLGYGVSLVLFILALRYLGTARTGAYYSIAPFVGAFLGVVFLGDAITLPLIIAGALMAAGVWLHATERHEHAHIHEILEHTHAHSHDEHHQHEHRPDDPVGEPHVHGHRHQRVVHHHPHYPDLHHRHSH